MKYITEEDLRDLYRKAPFTNYDLEPGVRLTPGARQFLIDKGIAKPENELSGTVKNEIVKSTTGKTEKKDTYKINKLYNHMRSVEALFLLTEEELLSRDVCLAQSVIKLGKQFSGIKASLKSKAPVENLTCIECTGIKNSNFSEDLEDCFEINEFHIQLEKGREIIVLHRLRCVLNELKPFVQELYEGSDAETKVCEDMIGKINQIINSLSLLICLAFGGKKCQRQN